MKAFLLIICLAVIAFALVYPHPTERQTIVTALAFLGLYLFIRFARWSAK